MARTRGEVLRSQADFVRARYGETGYRALLATLRGGEGFTSGSAAPQVFCPAEVGTLLRSEAAEADGKAAFVHARSIYRIFFGESDPVRALHLAAHVYIRYFAGVGRSVVEGAGTGARVRVLGVEASTRGSCLAALSYFRSAVHLSLGGRVEARELRCRSWGDPCCEFELRWTGRPDRGPHPLS
jgi:hypothetical protein